MRNSIRIIFRCVLIIGILIIVGCSRDSNPGKSGDLPLELQFRVDPALLEAPYDQQEYRLSLQAPKGWKRVSADLMQQLSEYLSEKIPEQEIFLQPIAIFLDNEHGSLLHLAHITNVGGQEDSERNLLERYQMRLLEKLDPNQMKQGEFSKDGMRIVQFLIQTEENITFKLLLYNLEDQLLEVDYVVPISRYNVEVKAIESSIGTIHLLN